MRLITALAIALTMSAGACSLVGTTDDAQARFSGMATMEETQLLHGVRQDLQGACDPMRGPTPEGVIGAIECRPTNEIVQRVVVTLFDTEAALMDAYLAKIQEHGMELRTNTGRCLPGEPSEGAYTPGDEGPELSATRGACLNSQDGGVQYLATLPPFVMIDVDGTIPDAAAVEGFAWLGNQDTPGRPTIWSGTGPMPPEK